MGLPQLLAGLHIQKGGGKENDGVEQHGEILHRSPRFDTRPRVKQAYYESRNDSARRSVELMEGKSKGKIKTGALGAGTGIRGKD
jgi:hypothetical protein